MVPLLVLILTSSTALGLAQQRSGQSHTVVARLLGASTSPEDGQFVVKCEHRSATAAIEDTSQAPNQIAILIDAGPSQTKVFSRERDLAVSVVKELWAPGTKFIIGKVGLSGKLAEPTADQARAINSIEDIVCETGKPTDVPIYDLTISAIRRLSAEPGIRVVIFIGGGKDKGSQSSYENLRDLAQAEHVTVFTLLLADRSHRGPRSMLSHGWWMRELAEETAGIFLENEKSPKALRQVTESFGAVRLLTFSMDYNDRGRHKISVKSHKKDARLRTQKAVFLGADD